MGRLRELVDEARSDMRTAPTYTDWLFDAVVWLALALAAAVLGTWTGSGTWR